MCYGEVLRLDSAFGTEAEIKLLQMDVVWWEGKLEGGKVKFTAEYVDLLQVFCVPWHCGFFRIFFSPRRNSSQWVGVSRLHLDKPHSVGFLRSSGQPVRALGGIRTRTPSKRASTDPPLRPRGYWDRHFWLLGKGLMTA